MADRFVHFTSTVFEQNQNGLSNVTKRAYTDKMGEKHYHTCQPIQFTSIEYIFFIIFLGGIWQYWKMDTGKHNFHEILLLF